MNKEPTRANHKYAYKFLKNKIKKTRDKLFQKLRHTRIQANLLDTNCH